jgi:hypothetical protein
MISHLLRNAIREILLEVSDEELEAKSSWMGKSPEERHKIWSRTLSDQQKSELAHYVLDLVGLVPGPGDVADVINAAIYAKEGQYALAALSTLCLIPAIGSAFGAAKIAGKKIPAKIIFEHADEIEKVVAKIAPELPNGEKVAEAVKKIMSDIKVGATGIDLSTGIATKSVNDITTQAASVVTTKWYSNPKWKEWVASIAEPNLTKVLNEATTTRARNRLAKILTHRNVEAVQKMKTVMKGPFGHLADDGMIAELLKQNTVISRFVSDNFSLILEDLKQNLRYRIIIDPADIAKFTSNSSTLAHADQVSKEVVIFLPRFEAFVKDPAKLTEQLVNAVKHETWHIIDSRLAAIFKQKMEGEFLSELDDMAAAMKKMTDNFNLSKIESGSREYISDPRELFVRVKEMRDFLKKTDFTASDLKTFASTDFNKVPNDITFFYNMMQGISDDAYKNLADAMNEIL